MKKLTFLSAMCFLASAAFAQSALQLTDTSGTGMYPAESKMIKGTATESNEASADPSTIIPFKYSAPKTNKGLSAGLRLGDPTGITVKKHMADRALEISLGRVYHFSGRSWYDNRFHDWYDDRKFDYDEWNYLGYRAGAPLAMQVHYLFNKNISSIGKERVSGLHWYYGFGGQLRFQRYYYDYRYKDNGSDWNYVRDQKVMDYDLGADGVIGIEHKFNKAPVSVFTDATLFMEIIDNPFLFWLQGGLGVRYHF
jgi:hypothetical protein